MESMTYTIPRMHYRWFLLNLDDTSRIFRDNEGNQLTPKDCQRFIRNGEDFAMLTTAILHNLPGTPVSFVPTSRMTEQAKIITRMVFPVGSGCSNPTIPLFTSWIRLCLLLSCKMVHLGTWSGEKPIMPGYTRR